MKLFSYYRSTAAYRIRIALQYKGIEFEYLPIDLSQGAQHQASYRAHNPQGGVPTLVDGDLEFGQSMAILEYLEERYPEPSLLPEDLPARAKIRYFSQIIVCDMHPLNNLSVLKYLRTQLHQPEEQVLQWYHHWLREGFDALEVLLEKNPHRGAYCFGRFPTFADVCLIPQVYNATRFDFPLDNYPRIREINEFCLRQPFFNKASPEQQIDFKPIK